MTPAGKAVVSLGMLASILGWCEQTTARPEGSIPPEPRPWAVLSFRDRGVSGRWGEFRLVFGRVLRPASAAGSGGWVLDQTFTAGGVINVHARADSRMCAGLDAVMGALPPLNLLGSYREPAPSVPEEPLRTLQSVDDDASVGDNHFKVSFHGEGAMGAWMQRLIHLPPRCWIDLKRP